MNEKESFSLRLRTAMEKAGYKPSPTVLEREFNTRYWGVSVSLQAVRRWIVGEAIPTQDKLLVLAEWLHLKPEYLRFGEDAKNLVAEHEKYWHEGLAYQEKDMFLAYLSLKLEQRKLIKNIIMDYYELNKLKASNESTEDQDLDKKKSNVNQAWQNS